MTILLVTWANLPASNLTPTSWKRTDLIYPYPMIDVAASAVLLGTCVDWVSSLTAGVGALETGFVSSIAFCAKLRC